MRIILVAVAGIPTPKAVAKAATEPKEFKAFQPMFPPDIFISSAITVLLIKVSIITYDYKYMETAE
jgi:hypothetical protein